jgi:hypothetical protein
MQYFDYEKVANEAKIPADKLAELCQLVRREFPRDEMMYELHLLRICMAIKDGLVSVEEALRSEPKAKV